MEALGARPTKRRPPPFHRHHHKLRLTMLKLVFGQTLAWPLGLPGVIAIWIVDSKNRAFWRKLTNFLNPGYRPSASQTVITCFVLILLSTLSARPLISRIPCPKCKAARWEALRIWLECILCGFFSPDFFPMAAWKERLIESSCALTYNQTFHKKGEVCVICLG